MSKGEQRNLRVGGNGVWDSKEKYIEFLSQQSVRGRWEAWGFLLKIGEFTWVINSPEH